MSDTIQSAKSVDFLETLQAIRGYETSATGRHLPFLTLSEAIDRLQALIDNSIEADRRAHIALGRQMERTERAEDDPSKLDKAACIAATICAHGYLQNPEDEGRVAHVIRQSLTRPEPQADDVETIRELKEKVKNIVEDAISDGKGYKAVSREIENRINSAMDQVDEAFDNLSQLSARNADYDDDDDELLRPCPFCGGAAMFDKDDDGWEWVSCTSCQASTNRMASVMEDCAPFLREKWNTRADLEAPK
jgi:ferredoxin